MTRKPDAPQLLIAVALFLAPLIGGQLSTDASPLDDLIGVLTGDAAAPLLTHALLFLPIVAAVLLLMRRRVVQVPSGPIGGLLLGFFGLIALTVSTSTYRLPSLSTAVEWWIYALVFFVTAASAGRQQGPKAFMVATFAGCSLLALRGIREYGETKALDPTWRIFAGWVNPNATAAMLLVGFFLGLGFVLTESRLRSLAAGVGTVAIAFAILLTQSKGALAVLVVVLVLFTALALSAGATAGERKTVFARVGAVLAMMAVLFVAVSGMTNGGPSAGGGALSRVANAGSTSEQSAGFRTLLWKGAVAMIKDRPTGVGIGAYRFESGMSGLHTQTHLTHNSFLQLATEGSLILPLLLLAAGFFWLRSLFKGWRERPTETRLLSVAIFGSVAAVMAHSLVDSDLYYFGIGFTFFSLLGTGLLKSVDAVAPEFVFPAVRRGAIAATALIAALALFLGTGELRRASARTDLTRRDVSHATETLNQQVGLMPFDGEAWYMLAQVGMDSAERLKRIQTAADFLPTSRNLRLLSRVQAEAGNGEAAVESLRTALRRDPNNLLTLNTLADQYRKLGDDTLADETLRRLIAVEGTSYFQVRSLPDLVPTETYLARITLAKRVPPAERIALLTPAMDGYRQYIARTVPQVENMAKQQPPLDYAGENVEKARAKLMDAAEGARMLADAYRRAGKSAEADAADADAATFSGALDK